MAAEEEEDSGSITEIPLKTYTNIWQVERKIYSFYDVTLPFPISFKQILVFTVVGAPWFLLMYALGLPFNNGFAVALWLGPPIGLTAFAVRPHAILQNKNLASFVISLVRFFLAEPKKISDMKASAEPENIRIASSVWRTTPKLLSQAKTQSKKTKKSSPGKPSNKKPTTKSPKKKPNALALLKGNK